jgi:hypothetical protein
MAIDSDKLMEMIKGPQSAGALPGAGGIPPTPAPTPATGAPSMSDASTAPMATPMSTPEPKMGNKEGALVNLSMAMDLIEQALPSLGSETEEGQGAMNALRALTKTLGSRKGKTNELQQSEILQMLQNLPQAGGATPEGRAMSQAPAVPNMPPIPGAAPGGAPTPAPM